MHSMQQRGRGARGLRFDIERVVGDSQYRKRVLHALKRRKLEDKLLSGNGRMFLRPDPKPI